MSRVPATDWFRTLVENLDDVVFRYRLLPPPARRIEARKQGSFAPTLAATFGQKIHLLQLAGSGIAAG